MRDIKDVVMMFKGLVIQNLYGLSDDQLEYQIEDRLSFQRFLGLNKHERSPDTKTFWAFREKRTQLELIELLFKVFFQQLNQAGYIARKGQIIDASFVPVPIQHNKRSENQAIKEGNPPEGWPDNKCRQKVPMLAGQKISFLNSRHYTDFKCSDNSIFFQGLNFSLKL